MRSSSSILRTLQEFKSSSRKSCARVVRSDAASSACGTRMVPGVCSKPSANNLLNDPAVGGIIVSSHDITERKRADEALRDSEQRYRGLFGTMQEGFALCEIICDANGNPCDYRFLEANDAFEQILGVTCREAVGKTIREIFPQVEEYWIETYGKVALTGEPVRFENYLQALDKHFKVVAFSPKHGQFAAIFSDITAHRQAETALREAEMRYRTLFEQSPVGVLTIDSQSGLAVEFNDLAARQLGYSREEFARLRVGDYEACETPEQTRAHIERVLREGTDQFETRHRTKTGEIRDMLVTIRAMELNGQAMGNCVFQDITESKRADEALKLSENKYRLLVDQSDAGILIVDETGAIQFANPKACEMCGYTAEELTHLSVADTYSPKEVAVGNSRMKSLLPGQTVCFERLLRRKDGSELLVEVDLPEDDQRLVPRPFARYFGAQTDSRAPPSSERRPGSRGQWRRHHRSQRLDSLDQSGIHATDRLHGGRSAR